MINIFNEYTVEPVKDYIFHRIAKKLLLELALRVERASSIKFVLTKAITGENTIGIAPHGSEHDQQSTFSVTEVLDASFRLSDRKGLSPDVTFSIGKGREPAYQLPDADGHFTPRRGARKFLTTAFQVGKKQNPYNNVSNRN